MHRPYTNKLSLVPYFECMSQPQGNNLCGFYVMAFLHDFISEKTDFTQEMVCQYLFVLGFFFDKTMSLFNCTVYSTTDPQATHRCLTA